MIDSTLKPCPACGDREPEMIRVPEAHSVVILCVACPSKASTEVAAWSDHLSMAHLERLARGLWQSLRPPAKSVV